LYTKPVFDYSQVEKQIDTIKKTNFDSDDSFAILLKRLPVTYVSKDPFTGTPSIGDEVWAVIRDNVITTIFFRNSHQRDVKVKNVNHVVNIKSLIKNYAEGEKNTDGTVDFNINNIQKNSGGSRKRVTLDLPVVELDGVKWYVDEANEQIISVKNIKKTLSFDDLDEKYLEQVINTVTM
jgi:hypothetical protein